MAEVTADTIAEAATAPAEASGDQGSAKAHPIPDMIEAAKFKAAADALAGVNADGGRKSAWRSAVTGRAVPPGAS